MRAIGWLLAVVGGLLSLVWFLAYGLVVTEAIDSLPMAFHVMGGVGLLLVGGWLFLDWGSLKDLSKDQTVGQAFTASLALLLGLGITIALNYIGYTWDYRKDLTANKRYSLSQQSIDIAGSLDKEISVIAFFVTGSPEESNFRELIKGYTEKTTLLKLEYHDPFSDPLLAEREELTSPSGTVILRQGEAEQRIEYGFDEEAITNAIVKLTSTKSHEICVIDGHGEASATDAQSPEGMGYVFGKLEKQNYTVRTVQLLGEPPTPEACEILVLGGPRTDLLDGEVDRVAAYVAGGGNFIALLNPLDAPRTAAAMARFGAKVGDDVVIEGDPYRQLAGGGPTIVVLDGASFEPHAITEQLSRGQVILALARSVGKGPEIAGLTVSELAHTTDQSWAETDLEGGEERPAQPDEGVDIVGKVAVAVAIEVTDPAAIIVTAPAGGPAAAADPAAPVDPAAPTDPAVPTPAAVPGAPTDPAAVAAAVPSVPVTTPAAAAPELPKKAGGKVVIFGDADFASNQLVANSVNQDFLLNSVAWMAREENQISIRANESEKGKLTVGVIEAFIAAMVAVIGVPGLAVVGAVGTWMRRRRM